ncbi:MAG: type II toxin-antitoxin system VapC family toxin [Chloroflexi bacterium]|nr:type II toxin-antitoxin system VapC family toxin [Chloroflexota bacterium]
MSYLLDTNVVSEARKPDADANVREWLTSVTGPELYLSVMVIGEIRQGIERLRAGDSQRAAEYERWLGTLRRDYADRIVSVTEQIAEEWGRLNAARPLPMVDGLLAASARVLGLTLVTRNERDFRGLSVIVLNPFNGQG